MERKSQAERHATISVILKYDLLRHENLREVISSKLSAGVEDGSGRQINQTLWEILFTLFADYLTAQTTLISNLQAETGFAKPTLGRHLQTLTSKNVIAVRTDDGDRRRRIISLTESYKRIVDQFVVDCSNEFRDLIHIHDLNEREAARESLVESEERFRDLVEGSVQGIYILQHNDIVFANRSAADILGYATVQDLMAVSVIAEIATPDERARLKTYRDARLRGEDVPSHYAYQGLRKDGSLVWLENQVRVVNWQNKRAVQVTFVDISERKQAEEALRLSEERFSKAFHGGPVAISISAIEDGRLLDVNPAWEKITGCSREYAIGKTADEIGGWVDANDRLAFIDRLKREGSVRDFEANFHRQDGKPRTAVLSGEIIEIAGERRLLMTSFDVTERRLVEKKLRESEERTRKIIEDSAAGYFRIDAEGRFTEVNSAWLHMHLYSSADEVIGQHFSITQVEEDLEAAKKIVAELMNGAPIPEGEFSRRCRDGSIGHHSFSANPVFVDGKIVGLEGFIFDITERKSVERRLAQARKMETVGQLTGSMAHHFNNMFQAIQSNLEVASSRIHPNSDAQLFAGRAMEVVSRGAELIQKLLAFSKRAASTPETVDPKTIITAAFSSDWQELEQGIEIELSCADDTPLISVDVSLFGKALFSLASNARNAMPNGGKLSISSRRILLNAALPVEGGELTAGEYAEILVKDEGCGMPPEILNRATEPFFTTRDIGQGSGLGLSMVNGLVQQWGGTIMIESEAGRGTTVRILVPAASAPQE
ncbi:MAG: PAS domain S-box protein [Rhodospirillales bacterium]|nr:PAS domain S-box protein [Rhodospirillales bacterium]